MISPKKPASPAATGRPRRLWLYAPFAALLIASCALGAGWVWLRQEVYRRMDAGAQALAESGYRIDWTSRSMTGFPFRLDLEIVNPSLKDPTGWGADTSRLKAEAFVFAPDHWVIVAPGPVVLHRRVGGPVRIDARALRASLSDVTEFPPRLSVEGLGLTFSAPPGSRPTALTGAEELHFHAKAGPSDQGAAYMELDKARTAGPGLLDDIAAGAPVTLIADGIYSHASAMSGRGFAGALRNWSSAGGSLSIRRLSLQSGATAIDAGAGRLGVTPDGRLGGDLDLKLKQPARVMSAARAHGGVSPEASAAASAVIDAHLQGGVATVATHFQAGRTTLGPVAVGPAPRIY